MQAIQAVSGEAFPPLADGVAVTSQFVGELLVGRPVVACGQEDKAAAEGEGLGRGASADEGFELLTPFRGEHNA